MSLNDQQLLDASARSAAIHPGIANPVPGRADPIRSNFVDDPTTSTKGAGAGSNFQGDRDAKRALKNSAGVIEARPGIIETTNIDPLNENSNKDDGWANATSTKTTTSSSYLSSAAQVVTGGAKMAYGTLVGDEDTKQAGKESVYGK